MSQINSAILTNTVPYFEIDNCNVWLQNVVFFTPYFFPHLVESITKTSKIEYANIYHFRVDPQHHNHFLCCVPTILKEKVCGAAMVWLDIGILLSKILLRQHNNETLFVATMSQQ